MKKLYKTRRIVSFCLAWVLMLSLAGPVTVHADLLEADDLILPSGDACFGEIEDCFYVDSSDMTIYTFLCREDPYEQMKVFAEKNEKCGLVLASDTKEMNGGRLMTLCRDGDPCVSVFWDKPEGVVAVAYAGNAVTLSEREDSINLYMCLEEYPRQDIDAFVKQCGKVLGTKAEKPMTLEGQGCMQILTRDGEEAVRILWSDSLRLLAVSFFDEGDPEKLGITLTKPEPETQKDEKQEEQKEEQKEVQQEETNGTVDKYSRALPDLASFLNTKYTQDVWAYTHYVTCLVNRSNKDAIVKAVLELLQEPRYQLKQMEKKSDSEGTHYTFEYTGKNEDVDWVRLNSGGKYHVKLTVKPYGSSQTALIMYTHPEFYLKDPGTRWDGGGTPNPTPAPESDYVNHTGVYILGIMKDYFGSPKKEDYNEDRYETNYYFSFSSYPESKFKSLRSEMEFLGLKCHQSSYSSDGGSKQLGVKAEGGSCLIATWRAKSGELQVTIKWEYVKKAGIFDSADVPAEPAPAPDPNPEPGKIDCPDCTDGRCNTCGGDGELDGLIGGIIGKQDDIKTCKDCHAGRCKTCYGNGKISN